MWMNLKVGIFPMNIIATWMDTAVFTWVVLPLLIFGARILDVSLGTIRIIFLVRGQRLLAPLLGFFEVLIWLLAIQQVMQNLNNPVSYIAYAGGFAAGNLAGIHAFVSVEEIRSVSDGVFPVAHFARRQSLGPWGLRHRRK